MPPSPSLCKPYRVILLSGLTALNGALISLAAYLKNYILLLMVNIDRHHMKFVVHILCMAVVFL